MARPKSIPRMTRHKASGRAVVRLDGKDRYLGPWGTREARAKYKRLIAEWQIGCTWDAGEPVESIAELAALYLRECRETFRKHGRPTSEVGLQGLAVRYLLTYAGLPAPRYARIL